MPEAFIRSFTVLLLLQCITDVVVRIWRLLCLSLVVMATFAVCWFPFLTSKELVFQVIHRLFPFARGLFEVCGLDIMTSCANVV